MKRYLLVHLLAFVAFVAKAQDSTTIWISTGGTGNIKAINLNDCDCRFVCATGKNLFDIAFTPNGKLWGNTIDSLYLIDTFSGATSPIGHIPSSNSLVGLNDSTLLIESGQDLYALKNTDASINLIGHIGYSGDGDLTWLGKKLYLYSSPYLVKITLDSVYSHILQIDTLRNIQDPYMYITYGLATAYLDSIGYSVIALPGDNHVYTLDSINANHGLACTTSGADSSFGASSMIFPPQQVHPLDIADVIFNSIKVNLYPNPTYQSINIEMPNILGNTSKLELLLYDSIGNLVVQKSIHDSKENIDVSMLNDGLYYICLVVNGEKEAFKKFLKVH